MNEPSNPTEQDNTNVSMSISVIIITLMMMTEMDIEMSVYYIHLTWLIAREDFIKFTHHESTKTYKDNTNFVVS
jgi:hypothetical protein